MPNDVHVKMRPATQPAQPFVTKAGEIWRTYGSDARAESSPGGSAGSAGASGPSPGAPRSACDLGPGNSSAQGFDAGNPCGDGLPQGEEPAVQAADPAASKPEQAYARSPSPAPDGHASSEGGGNAREVRRAPAKAAHDAARESSPLDMAASLLSRHEHAAIYAAVGIACAILIIAIGILPTLLIAALAAVGLLIGRYRDGDARLRGLVRSAGARRGK